MFLHKYHFLDLHSYNGKIDYAGIKK